MKHLLFAALGALLVLTGCPTDRPAEDDDSPPQIEYISFGEAVPEEGLSLRPDDLAADPLNYHGQTVRVAGEIVEVCRREGCWLALDNPAGEPVRVEVPRRNGEYEWVLPTELGRLSAIVEGTAYADTLSVEDLRHFAEDAGRPQADIDAIDDGQVATHITARGILVEQPRDPLPPDAGPDPEPVDPDVPVGGEPNTGAARDGAQ